MDKNMDKNMGRRVKRHFLFAIAYGIRNLFENVAKLFKGA